MPPQPPQPPQPPPQPPPPPPSTSSSQGAGVWYLEPVGGVSATAVAAAAAVIGCLPRGPLSTALLVPAVLLLAAWAFPAGVALLVRVSVTKAVHLSGLMAEDEEEEGEDGDVDEEGEEELVGRGCQQGDAEEGVGRRRGRRRGRRETSTSRGELGHGLGWEGVRGRAAVKQWEWKHKQQQEWRGWREHEPREEAEDGGEGSDENDEFRGRWGERGRRIDVEWEGGQLFLVVRRVVASEFLVNLVNRYMHGPIPMKVESCRAEMLRACLSPAQILRQGSFQATIVGLRTFGRRTHEDEWDESVYYEKAIRFHRWAADYVQSLIEGTYGRRMKTWGGLVDSLINNITFETRDAHLRIDDRFNGHCFGIFLEAFDCKPGVQEPESLGATPHEFYIEGVLFYVDPHNDIARSPECTAMTVDEGTFRVEFPDIFRTLILNREIMPGGRGKRLRVRGDFTGIVANVQANQMRTFLFSLLGTFCPYKYGAWKTTIREQAAADCRPVSPSLRRLYLSTFGTIKQEKALKATQRKERAENLIQLERRMSYRDILLLRRDARGWQLEDMGDEPPADAGPPLDPEMMEGISEEDPQYGEVAAFAARVQGLKLSAWEKSTCLREIMVETVIARQMEVRLYSKADKADGPEDKVFKSPLQSVMFSGKMEGRFRMFIARTKASNRLHSRAANGVDGEPALPWLMAGGTMQHPVVLDEATASRLGYGSSCVLGPSEARLGFVEVGRRYRDAATGLSDENGGGGDGSSSSAAATAAAVPQLGGTFRMWSDYKMALEGHASNVQAGTLLPPVLDMAKTVADSFRRRWAAGGQYPELVRARVRLAERGSRGDGDDGDGEQVATAAGEAGATAAAVGEGGTATEAGGETNSTGSGGKDVQGIWPEKDHNGDAGMHDPEVVPAAEGGKDPEVEGRESQGGAGDVDDDDRREVNGGGLRQVLSRLDGLDSGMLVERALEDHLQGEGDQADTGATTAAAASGVSGGGRLPSGGDRGSSLDGDEAAAAAAAATGEMPGGALSAALDGDAAAAAASPKNLGEGETAEAVAAASLDSTAKDGGGGDEVGLSSSGRVAGEAAAAAGMEESPVEDKFMLPGWHYLALSGRTLSVDLRWDNMDLVLMQDPTAKQGRDTGKNVLALRSSGALTVSSSGVGESVDVQLRNASLLPCFYADDEADDDGDGSSASGGEAEVITGVGPARRLALILGGGDGALRAVARTWLGQGLLTADSRPLLEPFTVQIGYGTVVAQAVVEGRGTGVTDGRGRVSSGLSDHDEDDSDDDEDDGEDDGGGGGDDNDGGGLLVRRQSLGRAAERGRDAGPTVPEDGEEQAAERGGIDQSAAGESVSGVFRVAVSELQLLGPKQRTEELATVEVEVSGQTRSFSASDVIATHAAASTTVGDRTIELEFACRCRLRRRRRRRRRDSADGSAGRVAPSVTGGDAVALDFAVGSQEGAEAQAGDSGARAEREETCTEEEETERRDAEPEAKARVRLRAVGGELLGEAWAELAGAPDDWARYPLYSPGAIGVSSSGGKGSSGGRGGRSGSGEEAAVAASGRQATGLDRGGVIPAPPATVRRRWGWGYRRGGPVTTTRRWFRPRPPPRDVAGEVRLRLGWVPSGLAVTVHGCRAVGAATAGTEGVGGDIVSLLGGGGGGRPRRSIVVKAEPGGGAARAHPVEVDDRDGDATAAQKASCTAVGSPGSGGVSGAVEASPGPAQGDDAPRPGRQEAVPFAGLGAAEAENDQGEERLFFVLDTACLLREWDGSSDGGGIGSGGGDGGGGGGGDGEGSGCGARLTMSMTSYGADAPGNLTDGLAVPSDQGEGREGEAPVPASVAKAELLLFPGAEAARRWVPLADPAGDIVMDVDVTIAWVVAPPSLLPARRSSSIGTTAGETEKRQSETPVLADGTASTTTAIASPASSAAGGGLVGGSPTATRAAAATTTAGSSEAIVIPGKRAAGGAATEDGGAGGEAGDGVVDDGGAGAAEAGVEEEGGMDGFPEPTQVVSRCFSMHASDLVLRVSDLDVAVLVTMAKGIVRILKPPKSKEEKELELEAVQQRLLEEANSKRNAAIQQLRATFQSTPGGDNNGGDGTGLGRRSSLDGENGEERLQVRDVLELLRDFLRAKALTESEISREAEEFMLVILAVEDEAKRRTAPVRPRARSASPTHRRRATDGSSPAPPAVAADDLGEVGASGTPSSGSGGVRRTGSSGGGGGGGGSGVDPSSFTSRKRWRTRLRPQWRVAEGGKAVNIFRNKMDSAAEAGGVGTAAAAGAKSKAPAAASDNAPSSSSSTSASSARDQGSIEGFICPQCHMRLASPAALLAHFHVFHGASSSGGHGGHGNHRGVFRAGGGQDLRRGSMGSEGSSDEEGGSGAGIWYAGGGGRRRRGSRSRGGSSGRDSSSSGRGSWRGASISLDHFILALQSFMEEQPDEGNVMARCEEFASGEMERRILGGYPSLAHRLAVIPPTHPLPEFWGVIKRETGATQRFGGGQQARVLQTRMVRALKSYRVARAAWAHLVVPALFAVPRCGSISAASGNTYLPMPCPVREGQPLYVDKPAVVITHMPPELGGAWGLDAGGGAEGSSARGAVEGVMTQGGGGDGGGGGGASGLLTGIMTYSKDRGTSGVRGFLTFTLDRPAVVYVCYDQRLKRLPVWLMYFEKTDWVMHTTDAAFGVWKKRYAAGQVKLGSNEGWRKGCAQYVVLLGADRDALGTDPGAGASRSPDPRERRRRAGGGGGQGQPTALRFADSQPSASRLSSLRPAGLFPDVEPGAGAAAAEGGGRGGDGAPPSPRWVLRPQTVAGGKGSLAQAVRALVDERRKSRAKSRSQLLPGGTSRSQLDEAAATAAELGLELAPVELQYTTAFDMGSMSFRVVNPSVAAEDAFHVKAELCLSHASGSVVLRHLHPGDWLGKPDSLTLRVNAGGLGTYYNPLVDKREHIMEPWSGLVECHSERGDPTTQLRVEMPEHLVINVTSALVENIKNTASLVVRNWAGRYTEPLVAAQSAGSGGTLLFRNTLGVEVAVQSLEDANWGARGGGVDDGGLGDNDTGDGWSSISGSGGGDEASEELSDVFYGDIIGGAAGAAAGSISASAAAAAAAATERSSYRREVSRPTAVAAGQAIECRLPARSEWRSNGGGGIGSAEFLVHVPGFQTVTGIRIGGRGARAYPLVQASHPPPLSSAAGRRATASGRDGARTSRRARGVAERILRTPAKGGAAAMSGVGLALVVDVGERNPSAPGGSVGGGRRRSSTDPDEEASPSSPPSSLGALVAELRTNVCVHNGSASDVQVDMAEIAAAAAAVATTPGAKRPPQARQQQQRQQQQGSRTADVASLAGAGGGGGHSSTVVHLSPGARLALPLSVLSSWQLRIEGDATDAWYRPLRLSPALLDPAVPNALRLTSDMERNSVCLKMAQFNGRAAGDVGASSAAATAAAAAAAQGEVHTPDPGSGGGTPSPRKAEGGARRKSVQHVGFSLPHSPQLSLSSASSRDGDDDGGGGGNVRSRSSKTSLSPSSSPVPPGGVSIGGATPSGTADWVLTVQPSYQVTNALPCAMEVEVFQPPLTGVAVGAERTERSRSWAGSGHDTDEPGDADDFGGSWRDGDSNLSSDDSDAASAASTATSRHTQQSESKARAVASAAADRGVARAKAAVRNPALDLFFLPTSSSTEAGADGGGGRGGGRARSGSRSDVGVGVVGRARSSSSAGGGGGGDVGAGGAGDAGAAGGGVDRGQGARASGGAGRNQRGWPWPNPGDQEQVGQSSSVHGWKRVWKGLIGSGQEAKLGRVDNNRPFYVRVRMPDPVAGANQPAPARHSPPCYHWSDFFVISTADHGRRTFFNSRQPEDITWRTASREDWGRRAAAAAAAGRGSWEYRDQIGTGGGREGRTLRQQCPEIKVTRAWGRCSARRLTFYAPYWVVNKTGLALNYRARYPSKSTFRIGASAKSGGGSGQQGGGGGGVHDGGGNSNVVRGNSSSSGSSGSNTAGVYDGGVVGEGLDGRGALGKGGSSKAVGVDSSRKKSASMSSAEEAARTQVSRLLLRDATYLSDEEHLSFFGGRSLPVMLACPSRKLEVMPYAFAARAEDAGLCVCDLQVDSDISSLYFCLTSPRPGSSLYTDCGVTVTSFPREIMAAAAGGAAPSTPRSTVQILTPWREPPAPEKEAFMTFWLTRDALVHVCMDSRTPPGKLPSWLEYAGFRKLPDAEVHTSEPGLTLHVYRRFFRARTLVKLGGSDNSRDLGQALTGLSGAAAKPDGPAPKGMLANYTVVLTTVPPPPTPASQLPPTTGPMQGAATPPGSGHAAHAKMAAAAAAAATYGEEADVRDALVDRDVTGSIVCRRRYRILPDFGPGDRPYVDRDYTIPSLPAELQGLRLTCIQTAQGDKRAGGSRLWRLSLMQESVVLIIFDARAQSVPLWLAASGFVLWEGVRVAGAQYRIPYLYKVYRKTCKTGLIWLGGNGARGCKGAKRGYFVLVHVAHRPPPPPPVADAPPSRLATVAASPPPPGTAAASAPRFREGEGEPSQRRSSLSSSPRRRLPLSRGVSAGDNRRHDVTAARASGGGGGGSGWNGDDLDPDVADFGAIPSPGTQRAGANVSWSSPWRPLSTPPLSENAVDGGGGGGGGGGGAGSVVSDESDLVLPSALSPRSEKDRGPETAGAGGPADGRGLMLASKNSPASRSFGSLEDLVVSPDAFDRAGAESGRAAGVEGGRPRAASRHERQRPPAVGLRRRGMSATDAGVFDSRAGVGGGGINRVRVGGGSGGRNGSGDGGDGGMRARAWTGGEEAVVDGGRGAGSGRLGVGSAARFGKASERSRGGLQHISPLWDTGKDGRLSQMPVPFDRVGRSWSRTFNVDAAKTGGPLETSGATLGVSVSALTGQFHRTRVVTLYPRLIVRNFLGFPLEVMPTVMSPKAAAVERLSQCIPPAMPPPGRDSSFLRAYRDSSRRHAVSETPDGSDGAGRSNAGGDPSRAANPVPASVSANAGAAAAVKGTDHLARTVPTSTAVIIYAFNAADQLVKGLATAAASSSVGSGVGGGSSGGVAGVGGDSDDHRKCVLLRATATSGSSSGSGGGAAAGEEGGDAGGFGPALASGLSRPVLAEEMGETHLWVVDSAGRRHLAAAFVSLQRATVFITLSASSQFPPFRVENRSGAETLAYRQVDAHRSMGWHILPPLSWHAFLWQEPDKPRAIQMAFASSLSPSHTSVARHSEEYSLDKIGVRDPLEEESITRSVITLVATGTKVKRLFSEVRVEGRTRVLSLGDVRLSNFDEDGHADSVTRLKRLYNQLDIGIRFAGLSFNVVECSTEGPSEVMSAHVDSVTVAKRSGDNTVELQVFHVQVDDMRRRSRMPVVLQPADSGFNSHLREGRGWGGGSKGAVPCVRLLLDKEVATIGMPHLRSLDLELQEMRANVDLEFVLHLLNLAGSLLPELTSEEVLAKMSRKKAKIAVRHTVPTPAKRDLSMVYVEAFRHSTIVIRMELWVGQAALEGDPEATAGGLTVLSGSFLTVLSVLGSSIAHVNPTFVFDELVVTHYCGSIGGLSGLVVTAITQQAVAQGYKVVGSMELLGDPLSLVSKLGDSVAQFFTKTKAEMTGDADTVGAGAKVLVKGLVGGTFGSAAKITGSLEGMIRGLSGTAIADNEAGTEHGDDDDGQLQGEVKDLEHGVKQGGKVFYETMKAGITGLIDRPAEGAKEEGFAGFIAGMAKGIVGAVAAPVAGALGAVSRVTEGVDASTRLSDEKRMGRRRAARTAFTSASKGRALPPLTPSDLVKNVPRRFATFWVGSGPASTGAAAPATVEAGAGTNRVRRDGGGGRGGSR